MDMFMMFKLNFNLFRRMNGMKRVKRMNDEGNFE